ncbi:hypothetical protein [Candidatus Nitrososphaera sp. FF02]|uniref:hypothetical protein n=1 Tax=Candidatus Nitrososphaera sp. FF02 TaxID=3398226 RepID=UPI0039E8D81E
MDVCRQVVWSLIIILIGEFSLLSNNPASGQEMVQLTVAAIDTDGNDVIGKYVELRQDGAFVESGFTPVTFVIENSIEYEVGVADFKYYLFDHWLDTGSTDRWRSVSLTEDAKLTAVYRIVIDDPTQPGDTGGSSEGGGGGSGGSEDSGEGSSSGGRGGGHSKTVIILVPENGETVSPTGISLSGVTVGNPMTVEVMLVNPVTEVSTPYLVVTPRSPSDFTWWSYSLEVNDPAMTQIQVRALFSDGSQRVDTVDVSYYTGPGTNKSIRIADSLQIADVGAENASHNIDIAVGTVTDTVDLDNTEIPDNVETVVDRPSQPSFELMIFFLIGLAIAAFLAWLAGWKRRLPAHQLASGS